MVGDCAGYQGLSVSDEQEWLSAAGTRVFDDGRLRIRCVDPRYIVTCFA
jgi:hypothetical protein